MCRIAAAWGSFNMTSTRPRRSAPFVIQQQAESKDDQPPPIPLPPPFNYGFFQKLLFERPAGPFGSFMQLINLFFKFIFFEEKGC